jgi:hypothetical protein
VQKIFNTMTRLQHAGVDAKHNAHCAKNSLQKCADEKRSSMQKALFHRMFLNFPDARAHACRVARLCAINFDFDRATMQSRVAACAHPRFVKR